MKHLSALLLTVICLCSACQTKGVSSPFQDEATDSAAIYQEMAYEKMFADSLAKAEQYAYRAFMLSRDSTLECGAVSLLCYIYYRQGKQQELQLLMQTVSPETYVNVMNVQLQVEQVKAGRERQYYALAILMLLFALGAICLWYVHRMRSLRRLYRQRIDKVMNSFPAEPDGPSLLPPAPELPDLPELHELHELPDSSLPSPSISEAKAGIDVLFAIINDQNISQMGKQEEQAVLKTLPIVDAHLAVILDKAASPLTPKETFFCIMEYYGKNDRQKARSFCCTEQAIRSTKSRLGKKFDISVLRPE